MKKPFSIQIEEATAISAALSMLATSASTCMQDQSAVIITGSSFMASVTAYCIARVYAIRHPEIGKNYDAEVDKVHEEKLNKLKEKLDEEHNQRMIEIEEMKKQAAIERQQQLQEMIERFEKIKEMEKRTEIKNKWKNLKK